MTRRAHAYPALLLLVAASAFLLRIAGLQFGLPAVYNPDEAAIMARALSFAKGTLNPHNFLYPTFYFYVLFGWVGGYLAWVWVTGGAASIDALQQLYFTDPTGIYTAGRALGTVCGTAAVVVLFKLGARLFDARTGLIAAAFLAVAPVAVRDSHYVKHDIPATLAVLVAVFFMCRLWQRAPETNLTAGDILPPAIATGVAFSTHYYCIFLAIPLVYAVVARTWRFGAATTVRALAVAAFATAATFFALSPFILVEPLAAWQDVVANRRIVVDRAIERGTFASATRYLGILWTESIGRAVLALGCAGAVVMLVRAPATAGLLVAFPVAFLAFIANTAPASRYLNPVLPFVALFAAWLLGRLADRLEAPPAALAVAVIAALAGPLTASIRGDLFFRQEDTRTLALRQIEQRVPAGTTLLVQPYSVPLTPSRSSLVEALDRHPGGAASAPIKFRIQLSVQPYPKPGYRLLWLGRGGLDLEKIYVDPDELRGPGGLKRLQALGVDMVILKITSDAAPELRELAGLLDRSAEVLTHISPYKGGRPMDESVEAFLHNADVPLDPSLERPGPVIRIWRVPHGS